MSFKIAGYNDTGQNTESQDGIKYSNVFGDVNVKEKPNEESSSKQQELEPEPVQEQQKPELPKQEAPKRKVVQPPPSPQHQQEQQETIVDKMADWAANVDLKGAKEKSLPLLMKLISPIKNKISKQVAIATGNNLMKEINKEFRHGSTVAARGFKFRAAKKVMMLLEYNGSDSAVKIPDTVANRPITAIKSGFLAGKALVKVKKLRLPLYLEVLPKNLFEDAKALEIVVVQKNVTMIVPEAFASCHPQAVYFMGPAPKGLALAGISDRTAIICKKAYSASYKGMPNLKLMK